ncbi:MAG: type II toxin-antitoxin system Phd/YefM family antitoxin [Verrucomicrobiales bacterium]
MHTIPATEAKNRFGEMLETAAHEPVGIAKNGRAVAVILSAKAYSEMERRLLCLERPTKFSSLDAWRKSLKKRKAAKPMEESDYREHLSRKYGR